MRAIKYKYALALYEIPTKEQQDELRNHCTWKWITQNGVKGYKVTSNKNSNSIFLPAAGYFDNDGLNDVGNRGCYGSSSFFSTNNTYNYYLYFNMYDKNWAYNYCFLNLPVRPIKSKTNIKNKTNMTLKEVSKIVPLKSGMCVELFKNNIRDRLILFQYGDGKICYIKYDSLSWGIVDYIYINYAYDVIKIYQSPTVGSMFDKADLIFNSDDYKIKELTMQEIADKFGIKVENLRIKE